MKTLKNILQKYSNQYTVTVCFALTTLYLMFVLIPKLNEFNKISPNQTIMDFSPFLTTASATNILQTYGETAIEFYKKIVVFDIAYPILMGLSFTLLIAF